MQATKGDHLVIHGRTVGNADRRGEVIDVRGQHGEPPYVVRWCKTGPSKTGPSKKVGHNKGKK